MWGEVVPKGAVDRMEVRFLNPHICDVVTETVNHTGYWIPD